MEGSKSSVLVTYLTQARGILELWCWAFIWHDSSYTFVPGAAVDAREFWDAGVVAI